MLTRYKPGAGTFAIHATPGREKTDGKQKQKGCQWKKRDKSKTSNKTTSKKIKEKTYPDQHEPSC